MNVLERMSRHVRISAKALEETPSPPFLVLFINSICNMKCEHCFYWTSLNKRDDLSKDEIFALSDSLGKIENLNLSGGEPFLRKEFAEICRKFITTNGARQIYVPSNGYFTDRCVAAVKDVLQEKELDMFVVELSLDGMPEFHDKFRVARHAFEYAMRTYDALIELQKSDPRLRIHSISTATDVNMEEIRKLTTYLYERCPDMDHHNLAIIRGDRKNPTLQGPKLQEYEELYEYIRRLWAPRETGRYGSIVEPMLQWAKVETVKQQRQVIPCMAGRISGRGVRQRRRRRVRDPQAAGQPPPEEFLGHLALRGGEALRESIARKECYCTTEVFMWSSIVYQPVQLVRAMGKGRVWQQPRPLGPGEREAVPDVSFGEGKPDGTDAATADVTPAG